MFSNILIYFVIIPLLMLGGFALCRDVKQIRAVAVTGSTVLIGLSAWLLCDYLALRAAGETAEMLYCGSWTWFEPLHINLAVGVDGVSIAMLLGACWKRSTWQGGLASVGVGTVFGVLYLAVPAFSSAVAGVFTGPAIPATLVALAAEVIVSLCTKKEEMSEEERLALVFESRGAEK